MNIYLGKPLQLLNSIPQFAGKRIEDKGGSIEPA